MPLCFGAGGRPGALLQGPPGEFSRATRVFSITKLAYAKKTDPLRRRSVVSQRNYIRKKNADPKKSRHVNASP